MKTQLSSISEAGAGGRRRSDGRPAAVLSWPLAVTVILTCSVSHSVHRLFGRLELTLCWVGNYTPDRDRRLRPRLKACIGQEKRPLNTPNKLLEAESGDYFTSV